MVSTLWLLACKYKAGREGWDPYLLRITSEESESVVGLIVEGRIAGPWVDELNRTWTELAPRLGNRRLSLDLRNVTYADAAGKAVLRGMVAECNVEVVVSSAWTQYLAEEIKKINSIAIFEEADVGSGNRNEERLQEQPNPNAE